MRTHYDGPDVARMIEQIVSSIASAFPAEQTLNIVGIRTRGEVLAARIADALAKRGYQHIGRGVVDVTLYRDDLSRIGPRPLTKPTQLIIDLDQTPLLLVDDVLHTGRSVRAAMNLVIDFGRPSLIRLVILVDRGGRELPIQPDLVALTLGGVPSEHRVRVRMTEVDGVDEIVVGPKAEVK